MHTPSEEPQPPSKHKVTIWTILVPIGAVLLLIMLGVGTAKSCLVSGDCGSSSDDAASANELANDLKQGARAKVRPGDSIGTVAQRFNLTQDELKACNPLVDPQTLQPGQFLVVSAIDCDGADLAPVGANPDPLAGELGGADGADNATAKADPSVDAAKEE